MSSNKAVAFIKNSSNKLGIIGGAGPMASNLLYHLLIKTAQKKYHAWQDHEFPEIVLLNVPFSPMLSEKAAALHTKTIVYELQHAINQLALLHVTHCIIACNTLHAFLESINFGPIKLISLIDETVKLTRDQKNVLILGTQTTNKTRLYAKKNCIVPDSNTQKHIDAIINQILKGIHNKRTARTLCTCIKNYTDAHQVNAVILACTELSVLNDQYHLKRLLPQALSIIDPLALIVEKVSAYLYVKK